LITTASATAVVLLGLRGEVCTVCEPGRGQVRDALRERFRVEVKKSRLLRYHVG
jgi:hypothetical protein